MGYGVAWWNYATISAFVCRACENFCVFLQLLIGEKRRVAICRGRKKPQRRHRYEL